MVFVVGVLFLGVFFDVFVVRYCGVVGVMGKMSMYVLVVCFSKYDSSHGVCKLGVGFVWLCMHIIDVRYGSIYW